MATFLDKIDVSEGSSMIRNGSTVIELVRIAFVGGVLGPGNSDALDQVVRNTPNMPQPWDEHPILFNLRALTYDVTALSGQRARVAIRYVNTVFTVIRGGSTLESSPTNQDVTGDDLKVMPPVGRGSQRACTDPMSECQPGEINTLVPRGSLVFERVERAKGVGVQASLITPGPPDPGIDPIKIGEKYNGKVNRRRFLHGDPGEWLMENVTFDNSEFGNAAWRMSYEMRKRRGGWNPTVYWIDRETGKPGVGTGSPPMTSSYVPVMYRKADFDDLELV